MKKFICAILVFLPFSIFAQINTQDANVNQVNSTFNKNQHFNRTCIAMLEELEKMKSSVKEQHPATVNYFQNKETYIRAASEWVKVCILEKK